MNATSPNPVPNPPPTTTPHSSRFLYVVNSIERTVSGYSINGASGALSPLGVPMATGDAPIYAAATQDGKFLYVANGGTTSDVSAYRINQTSGVLPPTAPASFATTGSSDPLGIATDRHQPMYTQQNAHATSAFAIDTVSGTLSDVTGTPVMAPTGVSFENLAVSSQWRVSLRDRLCNESCVDLRAERGGLPVLSGPPAPAGTFPEGIAVDATGKFAYVANWISNDVTSYTITPGTGGLVPASRTLVGAGCAPQELTLDPSSTHLFVSCPGLSAIVEFSIDAATGALMPMTPVFSTGPAAGPRGVAVDASGAFLYSAWNSTSRAGTAAIHNDGSLATVAGTAATGNGPIGVVVSGTQ